VNDKLKMIWKEAEDTLPAFFQ